jgi:hypothetical protein
VETASSEKTEEEEEEAEEEIDEAYGCGQDALNGMPWFESLKPNTSIPVISDVLYRLAT